MDQHETALRAVHHAATTLMRGLDGLGLDELAPLLAETEGCYRALAVAVAAQKDACVTVMEAADVWVYEADSLPAPLRRSRTGTSPQWNGRQAALAVAAQVADEVVDRETGEVPPIGVICEQVANAIVDCAGLTPSKAWRKGSLSARNIDPSEYVREREGTPTVRFGER